MNPHRWTVGQSLVRPKPNRWVAWPPLAAPGTGLPTYFPTHEEALTYADTMARTTPEAP